MDVAGTDEGWVDEGWVVDEGRLLIRRQGGMFNDGSFNKADLATNLAIQLLADGGWSALTLRNLARDANVTPQAIAAWFPSTADMRAAIAGRYGERWIRERGYQARRRIRPYGSNEPVTLPKVALSLLPATRLEALFEGVWLTIVEAGRWDASIGDRVAAIRDAERDLVLDLLVDVECRDEDQREDFADLVLTLTQGLAVGRTAPLTDIPAERAERAEQLVADVLSGVR